MRGIVWISLKKKKKKKRVNMWYICIQPILPLHYSKTHYFNGVHNNYHSFFKKNLVDNCIEEGIVKLCAWYKGLWLFEIIMFIATQISNEAWWTGASTSMEENKVKHFSSKQRTCSVVSVGQSSCTKQCIGMFFSLNCPVSYN